MPTPLPIAVLISGGGTTLRNLIRAIATGALDAEIAGVLSSNSAARGLQFARDAQLPIEIIEQAGKSPAEYGELVFGFVRSRGARLVAMAGFLKQVEIPADFEGRVMNIHPSLIPAFCGKGFYGERVHRAVLEYGAKVSGCTLHFVDNQYDHGPIIAQRVVPVLAEDTHETLAERVFSEECRLYPEGIQWYAEGRIRIEGRRVTVLPRPV